MSLLGKILAFLNILGMTGLMVLALMVYTKRQAWEYANYRHDLAEKGLPLTSKDVDARGNILVEEISQQTQKDLFPSSPVLTQVAEVERVQKAMQVKLTAESNPQKQTVLYTKYLMPLAVTNAQRERLLSIRWYLADEKLGEQLKQDLATAYSGAKVDNMADPDAAFVYRMAVLGGEPRAPFTEKFLEIVKKDPAKAPADAATETLTALNTELKDDFAREFKEVLEGKRQGKEMSRDERKDAIAYLLFCMVEAEASDPTADGKEKDPKAQTQLYQGVAYKRYINVVGMAAANKAINRQVVTLRRILTDLAYEQSRDRDRFANNLMPTIIQARVMARELDKQVTEFEKVTENVGNQKKLVNKTDDEVKAAEIKLDTLRNQTATKLVELHAMSEYVFNLRVKVREKTVTNQENERLLRQLEGWRWVPFIGGKFLIDRDEP